MLRLDRPIALAAGDRFVLRRPAPAGLLCGGVALDASPAHGVSRRRQTIDRVEAFVSAVADGGGGLIGNALLELHGLLARRHIRLASDIDAALSDTILGLVEATMPGTRPSRRHAGGAPAGAQLWDSGGWCATPLRPARLSKRPSATRGGGRVRGRTSELTQHATPALDPELARAMERLMRVSTP
jgi:hypothetical protein